MADLADGLVEGADGRLRCWWCGSDPDYVRYHDEDWGTPMHGDRQLFELLCLEGFQAGLSWITILRKRPAFQAAFDGFDPEVVAHYGPAEVDRLMADAAIVRNRAKVEATIRNAQALHALQDERGPDALDRLVWTMGAHPPRARLTGRGEIPADTEVAKALSKELKRLGFRFVGPTIVYAFLQSAGVVDDHLVGCWRAEVSPS
jgi:DNA-3-methyladenine glycosylase I